MNASKIERTWNDRIDSGRFTKSECLQWAHAVIPISRGERPGGFRTNLTMEEACRLRARMENRGGVLLEEEHTALGLAWISRNAKRFPAWVTDDFAYFSFQGDAVDIGHRGWAKYVPVWRIHGRSGQTLDYTAAAWQTGRDGFRIWEPSLTR